jgi:hypothetical protein
MVLGPLENELTVLELLDRLLDKGVVLTGDITLSVADVDLVRIGLRLLISAVEATERLPENLPADGSPDGDPRTGSP